MEQNIVQTKAGVCLDKTQTRFSFQYNNTSDRNLKELVD